MFPVIPFILLAVGAGLGVMCWSISRRFVSGDAHALDGIVRSPVPAALVFHNVAVWNGRSDRVEPGKVADLVLLEGDPMADIDALRNVALVVKEGRVVCQR